MGKFLLTIVLVAFFSGCESHYEIYTDTGVKHLTLDKALKEIDDINVLWDLYSMAYTLEDRERISNKIESVRGYPIPEGRGADVVSSTYEERLRLRRKEYVKSKILSDDVKQAILSGKVFKGMTKEDVLVSIGDAGDLNIYFKDGKVFEEYKCGVFSRSEKRYYFEDGKLVSWD